MVHDDVVFEVAGQKYMHIGRESYEDWNARLLFRTKCKYETTLIEDGQSTESFMNVKDECSMLKLINHWNRDARWKYVLKECR